MFVRFHVVSNEPIIERALGEKSRATANINDLIHANFQITLYFVRRPPLINTLCLIDAFLTITVLQKESKIIKLFSFLACLTWLCVFHVFNVKSQKVD